MKLKFIAATSLVFLSYFNSYGQILKLEDALYRTQNQYDKIKAKQQLVDASAQNTAFQKQQYLPDFTLSAQQSFGTINVQHGPMYAYGGLVLRLHLCLWLNKLERRFWFTLFRKCQLEFIFIWKN